jgi:hypothetical protein
MDLWMPDVRVAKIAPRIMDKTGRFSSPLSSNVRTITRPADRWGFQLDYMNLAGMDRARLESLVANQRGAANRLLYSPGDYVQRGSFPSGELIPNNNFSNGITGWGGNSGSIAVADRSMRPSRAGSQAFGFGRTSGAPVTPYAPYVWRVMVQQGLTRGAVGFTTYVGSAAFGANVASQPLNSSDGLQSLLFVTSLSSVFCSCNNNGSPGIAGDYFDSPFTSLSQCALVDNGPNLLLQSDTPGGTSWVLNATTAAANGSLGPDGSISAYYLAETTATSGHNTTGLAAGGVSSAAADFSFSVYVQGINRSWCYLQIVEQTASTAATAYFNSVTGALGSTPSTGANWSNLRTAVENCGNGWFRFTITARKTNGATGIYGVLGAATADNISSYTGVASPVALLSWRASLAQSSFPVRAVQTLTATTPGVAQTGNTLYLKGLPASTNGLLLPGDWLEVNKELKRVTSALNSNSSGLGYLQFSPPLRNSPADNDPVIVNMPMGRFIFSAAENGWSAVPPYFANSTLDLVEAL